MKVELTTVQLQFICNMLIKNDTDEADAILTSICADRMASRQNSRQKMTDIYNNTVERAGNGVYSKADTTGNAPDGHYYKCFPEM